MSKEEGRSQPRSAFLSFRVSAVAGGNQKDAGSIELHRHFFPVRGPHRKIVGYVGTTGNARTVGCHLHFEGHVNGRPVKPGPYLRAWDRYS